MSKYRMEELRYFSIQVWPFENLAEHSPATVPGSTWLLLDVGLLLLSLHFYDALGPLFLTIHDKSPMFEYGDWVTGWPSQRADLKDFCLAFAQTEGTRQHLQISHWIWMVGKMSSWFGFIKIKKTRNLNALRRFPPQVSPKLRPLQKEPRIFLCLTGTATIVW